MKKKDSTKREWNAPKLSELGDLRAVTQGAKVGGTSDGFGSEIIILPPPTGS